MPRKIVGFVLAVLMLASLFGERSFVANVATVADGAQHVVKPGDTLGAIAAQYGVTIEQLVAENNLPDPDRLAEGQTLHIPSSGNATAATAPPARTAAAPATQPANTQQTAQRPAAEYIVQSGDTVSGIAKALGVPMKALLDANPLADPDKLTVGQKLNVPAGAQPAAPTTAQGPGQPSAPANGQAQPAPDASAVLDKLAQQYGVDRTLVRALAWTDTNGKPRTLDAVGIGYLKVTGPTFDYIQVTFVKRQLDRENPADNAEAGVAYLAAMLKWGGDEPKGLAGFIQGPGSVTANGVRPATDDQVKRVLAVRDRVKVALGQPASAPAPATTQSSATAPSANTTAPTAAQAPASQPAPAAQGPTSTIPPAPAQSTAQNSAPAASTGSGLGAGAGNGAPPAASQRNIPIEGSAMLAARAIGAARSVAGAKAKIGIAGHNLVSGARISISSDQPFPAASVDKLALLVEAYRQQNSGARSLTGAEQNDLRAMIVQSDNDAANRLLELFGPRAVNASLQALGLAGTKLLNPFGSNPPGGQTSNVTTAADMVRLMDLMAAEQLVSAQASREMRALLLQTQDGSKLRRGLPTDAKLAHKSGWYDSVANDVGIVTHGSSSYVIAVFTDGIQDDETGNQTIAAVAKVIHESWGTNQ